jgi:hypothetical protein
VEKVALELVHAAFAVLAKLGMKEDAVGVVANGKELADHRVGRDADGFVVLNRNHR